MYNPDWLSHSKLANSSSLSSSVASLWDRYQLKLANGNVYKVDLFGNWKLAYWNLLLSSVGEIWMLRGRTSVQAFAFMMNRSN